MSGHFGQIAWATADPVVSAGRSKRKVEGFGFGVV